MKRTDIFNIERLFYQQAQRLIRAIDKETADCHSGMNIQAHQIASAEAKRALYDICTKSQQREATHKRVINRVRFDNFRRMADKAVMFAQDSFLNVVIQADEGRLGFIRMYGDQLIINQLCFHHMKGILAELILSADSLWFDWVTKDQTILMQFEFVYEICDMVPL